MPTAFQRATILLASLAWIHSAFAQQQPNILLIVVDDIGYSDLGAFGGEISTPNIDTLAERGVRLSNFHAASSCAPTRAMLLTGVESHRAGVGSMRELMPLSHRGKPGYDGVLNDRVQTIATLLQASGYRTTVAGKWHLGTGDSNLPGARGFDQSIIQADSGSDNFEMRPYLPMKPEVYWYENGQRLSALPENFYSSRFFVDKTIEFLTASASQGQPFFAYVAFQANHTPVQAPAQFIDRYRGDYTQGWAEVQSARLVKAQELGLIADTAVEAAGPSQAEWDALTPEEQYFEARRMQAYAGMATAMDHEVGRLVDHLRANGQYENTVFILLSDNGATIADPYENPAGSRWLEEHYHREVETLGEKGSWISAGRGWGRVSNTPFSGYKFYAGEGGVRVPLIVAGLPHMNAGAVYADFVYVTDLAPTILEIAGLSPPEAEAGREPMTGVSLVALLSGQESSLQRGDVAIGYEFSGNSALYRGDYKLVRNQPPAGDRQWRLYNISEDPAEALDLSERKPALFQAMRADYEVYATDAGVLLMPENYSLPKQVMINTVVFYLLPKYAAYFMGVLVLAVALYLCWRRRRAVR